MTICAAPQDFSVKELLLAMHSYFLGVGLVEIHRMLVAEDKLANAVKTSVHKLCTVLGTDILDHVHVLPQVRPVPGTLLGGCLVPFWFWCDGEPLLFAVRAQA